MYKTNCIKELVLPETRSLKDFPILNIFIAARIENLDCKYKAS